MGEGSDKTFPVAGGEKHAEAEQQGQANAQQLCAMALKQGPSAIEKAIRAPQRNAEEQVLMQQALPKALALLRGLWRIAGTLFGIQGRDQIVPAEKTQQFLQFGAGERYAGLAVGGLQHTFGIAQLPVTEQAHGGCAEFEITSAQRVG